MLNFFKIIQNSGSQLYKDFTFEEKHIVILVIIVPNDEVFVPLQDENTVVHIQFILK